MRVKNLVEFHLGESSDKALSTKHASHAELDRSRRSKYISGSYTRPKTYWGHLGNGLNESPKARIRPGSKRTLSSYHEIHKGIKPKTY